VDVSESRVGDPVLTISHVGDPRGRSERQRNVFVYLLAAELEQRSEALHGRWVISPQAFDARITVESPAAGSQFKATWDFVTRTLEDLGLA
jgi:hypothetical protein